jgi:hypothetical protein
MLLLIILYNVKSVETRFCPQVLLFPGAGLQEVHPAVLLASSTLVAILLKLPLAIICTSERQVIAQVFEDILNKSKKSYAFSTTYREDTLGGF